MHDEKAVKMGIGRDGQHGFVGADAELRCRAIGIAEKAAIVVRNTLRACRGAGGIEQQKRIVRRQLGQLRLAPEIGERRRSFDRCTDRDDRLERRQRGAHGLHFAGGRHVLERRQANRHAGAAMAQQVAELCLSIGHVKRLGDAAAGGHGEEGDNKGIGVGKLQRNDIALAQTPAPADRPLRC